MTPEQAKVASLAKELARQIVKGEITYKELWDSLDEIEIYKIENKITNKGWNS